MKFRVERDALADAVSLGRPQPGHAARRMPVLAGLLLTVDGDQLTVSGFDLEASTEVDLEVTAGADRPGAGVRPAARRHHQGAAAAPGRRRPRRRRG